MGNQLSYELYQQMLKKKVSQFLMWLNFREKLIVWSLAGYHHKSNHFQNSLNDTFAKLTIQFGANKLIEVMVIQQPQQQYVVSKYYCGYCTITYILRKIYSNVICGVGERWERYENKQNMLHILPRTHFCMGLYLPDQTCVWLGN